MLAEEEQAAISPEKGRAQRDSTLQLVDIDLIGPIYPKSLGGFQYIHIWLDGYSKRLAVYYLETKQKLSTLRVYTITTWPLNKDGKSSVSG